MMLRVSVGGSRLRVHLSNAYGTTPLMIGAAHVALHAKESEIRPPAATARSPSMASRPSRFPPAP